VERFRPDVFRSSRQARDASQTFSAHFFAQRRSGQGGSRPCRLQR
jgi:hypothetical protein